MNKITDKILSKISKELKKITKDYLFSSENEKKEQKKVAKHFKDVYGSEGFWDKDGKFHTKISFQKKY